MNNELLTAIGITLVLSFAITATIVSILVATFVMDKLQPERLERFKLKQYAQGVKDATRSIKVEK